MYAKIILALFSAAGGGFSLLFLIVPVGRITITYPNELILGMSCSSGSPLSLSLYQEQHCIPVNPQLRDIEIKMEACGFVCQALTNNNDSKSILNTKSYGIQMHNLNTSKTTTFTYEINQEDIVPLPIDSSLITRKTLKNDIRYSTSIRKLSENSYFFPTPGLYNFSCGFNKSANFTNEQSLNCIYGTKDTLQQLEYTLGNFFSINAFVENQTEDDVAEKRQIFQVQQITEGKNNQSSICLENFPRSNIFVSVNVQFYQNNESVAYKSLDLGSCASRCLVTSERKHICKNPKSIKELNVSVTFWSYLVARVLIGMISGTAFAMYEGAVIAILREHKADYGLQRIYATIGGMISSPLSGFLIDYASKGKGYTDFRPVFFLYAALKLLCAVLILFMNLEFKTPATNVISDVYTILRKIELIALFIACFILGTAWGYIESFLFWLIQDLGGTKSLMGITITVGGIAGIPLLVLSGPIIKRIGHANVLFIGFIFYAIRLLGYSLIYDPWLCLIFEAMESITSSLTFTAAVTYAAKLSTITTDSSIQGMLGGLYYGVGKGAGSLIGGYLMKAVGTRKTFQIFSGSVAVIGCIYFAFNQFYIRKRPSEGRDITKKDSIKPPESDVDEKISKNGAVLREDAISYEDALTNLGYEDTELDQTSHTNEEKNS